MIPRDFDDNDDYDVKFMPEGGPLDEITEFKFHSKEDDFGNAVKKIYVPMAKKNTVLKVDEIGVSLRCSKFERGKIDSQYPTINYALNNGDKGLVSSDFWDSKKGYTLVFKKMGTLARKPDSKNCVTRASVIHRQNRIDSGFSNMCDFKQLYGPSWEL